MIENDVDKAIVSLLKTIPGLRVFAGMQDNEPVLETPYCAVYSNVQRFEGRTPIYQLLTTIEYQSVSGQDSAQSVQIIIAQIDQTISEQPPPAILAGLELAPFDYLAWESIPRTQQDVGDRRKNIRELQVFAQLK